MDGVSALGLGLLLGARHAADPDHVAAIAQLVSGGRTARSAFGTALVWGLGHSTTLLLVGGALVLSGARLPAVFDAAVGFVVAGTLLLLALMPRRASASAARPAVVGLIHGLAGSGAVTLLALGAMPSRGWALAYLVVSCAGTVAAMVAGTGLLMSGLLRGPRALLGAFDRAARIVAVVVAIALVWSSLRAPTADVPPSALESS
jgi:nickel/cobalt exporter